MICFPIIAVRNWIANYAVLLRYLSPPPSSRYFVGGEFTKGRGDEGEASRKIEIFAAGSGNKRGGLLSADRFIERHDTIVGGRRVVGAQGNS